MTLKKMNKKMNNNHQWGTIIYIQFVQNSYTFILTPAITIL